MDTLKIKKTLSPIFRQYRIEKAILFGSFARGEHSRRSDVDLILIKETPQRFFERYDGILADLNKAIPALEVDALIYTPDELEQIAHRPFIAQALKEGKVIYESGYDCRLR
ncbi:MAG: nucleotidyltransferase domain-containing protein [Chloroflexota bacterium]